MGLMLVLHPDFHSATHSTTAGVSGRDRGCLLRILSRTLLRILYRTPRLPSESVVMAHDGDTIRFVLLFTLLGGSRE